MNASLDPALPCCVRLGGRLPRLQWLPLPIGRSLRRFDRGRLAGRRLRGVSLLRVRHSGNMQHLLSHHRYGDCGPIQGLEHIVFGDARRILSDRRLDAPARRLFHRGRGLDARLRHAYGRRLARSDRAPLQDPMPVGIRPGGHRVRRLPRRQVVGLLGGHLQRMHQRAGLERLHQQWRRQQ